MPSRTFAYARALVLPAAALLLCCFDPVPGPSDLRAPEDLTGADLSGDMLEVLPDDCRTSPCPESRPICDPAGPMCRMCQEASAEDSAACQARGQKRCAAGRCVSCTPLTELLDCGLGLGCIGGACKACASHRDCLSDVCDVYQKNSAGTFGRCVPEGEVVYVDNAKGACSGSHAGTRLDKVCTLGDGVAKLVGQKTALRVYGSTADYGTLAVSTGTVTIYGPADPAGDKATLFSADTTKDLVAVSGTATVTLDGVELKGGSSGVRCSGAAAKATLRRGDVLSASKAGVDVQACTITLDRVHLALNKDGAVNVSGGGKYAISNSFIVGNTSMVNAAVRFSDDSTGQFRFNTVAYNGSIVPAAMSCGQPLAARNIEDSILYLNTIPAGRDSQLSGNCTLVKTVVGAADKAPGGVALDPEFAVASPTPATVADFRLSAGAAKNAACCIDRAMGMIERDFFGAARTNTPDVGAHEAK